MVESFLSSLWVCPTHSRMPWGSPLQIPRSLCPPRHVDPAPMGSSCPIPRTQVAGWAVSAHSVPWPVTGDHTLGCSWHLKGSVPLQPSWGTTVFVWSWDWWELCSRARVGDCGRCVLFPWAVTIPSFPQQGSWTWSPSSEPCCSGLAWVEAGECWGQSLCFPWASGLQGPLW